MHSGFWQCVCALAPDSYRHSGSPIWDLLSRRQPKVDMLLFSSGRADCTRPDLHPLLARLVFRAKAAGVWRECTPSSLSLGAPRGTITQGGTVSRRGGKTLLLHLVQLNSATLCHDLCLREERCRVTLPSSRDSVLSRSLSYETRVGADGPC